MDASELLDHLNRSRIIWTTDEAERLLDSLRNENMDDPEVLEQLNRCGVTWTADDAERLRQSLQSLTMNDLREAHIALVKGSTKAAEKLEELGVSMNTDHPRKETNPKDAIGIAKAPLSCVPGNVLVDIGLGMMDGATKHGRHNYRHTGVRASVYYDATMRHLIAWWEGEDIDKDSGINHVVKAITSLVVLRDAMHQDMLNDDRPPSSKPFYPLANEIAKNFSERDQTGVKHYTREDDFDE